MSFPIINYKYNGLEEAKSLTALVDQKFAPFERYLSDGGQATCDVEFEKVATQQTGKIYRVEANLLIDGTLSRAESTEENFEKAVDEVRRELDKTLRRSHKKQLSLLKRAGRGLKRRLRRGPS